MSEQSEQNIKTRMNACFTCSDFFKKRSDKPPFVPTFWGNSRFLASIFALHFETLHEVLKRKCRAEMFLLPPIPGGIFIVLRTEK